MWTRSNRSFIAVSVHYIDTLTENVKTEFIACELFEGHHTNDRVADKLNKIFDSFGILEKVFFITTDGAGNYVAAFKYYGDDYESIRNLTNEDDYEWMNAHDRDENNGNENDTHIDLDSDDEFDADHMVRDDNLTDTAITTTANEQIRVLELFSGDLDRDRDAEDADLDLENGPCRKLLAKMNRVACSSHLLDKVGSKDALKANENTAYKTMYDGVFEKLQTIWKQKDSRISAEVFTRITGRKLIGPHPIRWLKTFDAVSSILIAKKFDFQFEKKKLYIEFIIFNLFFCSLHFLRYR